MHGRELEIYASFVKEGNGESFHIDHLLKHTLPVLDGQNLNIVEKGPASILTTEDAHVVSSSEDGHAHENVANISLG